MPGSAVSEDLDSTMLDDDSSTNSIEGSTQPLASIDDAQSPVNLTQSQPSRSSTRLLDPSSASQKGLNANGKRTLASATDLRDSNKTVDGAGEPEAPEVPGSSWRNPKAQQEIAKAMEAIVDKEFMIGSEYTLDELSDVRTRLTISLC
jgi:hypothetical protein